MLSINGPYEGKVNDLTIARDSYIQERMHELFDNRLAYYLYGDSAYKALGYVFGPYLGGRGLTLNSRDKEEYNRALSSVRILIE